MTMQQNGVADMRKTLYKTGENATLDLRSKLVQDMLRHAGYNIYYNDQTTKGRSLKLFFGVAENDVANTVAKLKTVVGHIKGVKINVTTQEGFGAYAAGSGMKNKQVRVLVSKVEGDIK